MPNDETGPPDNVKMDHPGKVKGYEWVVLSVTTVGVLLASIQESALLISLPDMMSDLHMEFLTVMWVLLSYLLITTVMVPIFGRLSDMFGRKRFYVLGFALFTIGSLLGSLAQPQFHGWDLVGYRIIQALGGALLFANGTAMVADAFEARRLGFGLGVNMVAAGAGIVLGPVVGGILSPLGWQWIFLINVPFGVVGTIWAIIRLKEPVKVPKSQIFDWAGSATFLVGLAGLLMAVSLVAFPLVGSDMVDALFVIGIVGIIAFLIVERRAKHPMMDLGLFRNRE
ncbi:MAG: MFS transporter, partial [Methanomassiliicoccales archaeon]